MHISQDTASPSPWKGFAQAEQIFVSSSGTESLARAEEERERESISTRQFEFTVVHGITKKGNQGLLLENHVL